MLVQIKSNNYLMRIGAVETICQLARMITKEGFFDENLLPEFLSSLKKDPVQNVQYACLQ